MHARPYLVCLCYYCDLRAAGWRSLEGERKSADDVTKHGADTVTGLGNASRDTPLDRRPGCWQNSPTERSLPHSLIPPALPACLVGWRVVLNVCALYVWGRYSTRRGKQVGVRQAFISVAGLRMILLIFTQRTERFQIKAAYEADCIFLYCLASIRSIDGGGEIGNDSSAGARELARPDKTRQDRIPSGRANGPRLSR